MPFFDDVSMRSQGAAAFICVTHKGRAVEISDHNGGFWLEFWAEGDEYGSPAKEISVETGNDAVQNAIQWLR